MSKPLHERFRFEMYRGTRIYIADYSDIRDAESAIEAIRYSKSLILKQPKSSVYSLLDFTNGHFEVSVLNEMRKMIPVIAPHVAAQAMHGLRPTQRIVYNNVAKLIRTPHKAVSTLAEGKEFLYKCREADMKARYGT